MLARWDARPHHPSRVHHRHGWPATPSRAAHDGRSQAVSAGGWNAFGSDIDYAVLQKIYGSEPTPEKRYSPAGCLGCKVETLQGDPDPKHISTSYVERQNLTMRMSMRRFTHLTNAFSKKVENHAADVGLYFMWDNFGRVHQTLRVTSAMEAIVSDHVWSVAEIVNLRGK